ncbi:MFS transporter [Nocardia sp. NPDC006630]|uniref:MFS transporter n=1 Tax=Nocardia sp. NPDC006630 TaxID=3157181 RepID=UPI0033B6D693
MSRTNTEGRTGMRRLLRTVPFVSAAPQLTFAVSNYFAALQVQHIDEAAKVGNLAVVHVAAATAALVTQPLVGVLSDRTRSAFGRRAPWMLIGVLMGAVGLITAGLSTSLAMLVIAVMVVHVGANAVYGPLSAILPDRVPVRLRGRYSTLAGLGTIVAAMLGPLAASAFSARIPLGYLLFAGLIVVAVVGFVVLNPEPDNRDAPRPEFSAKTAAQALWIDPRHCPDLWWAFLGRFLILGGYYMVLTYTMYIAQGYVGLSAASAAKLVPLIGLVGLPGLLVAIAVAGPWSDRTGRRKPLTLAGGLVIAASALVPLALPTVTGLLLWGVVVTIGFGIFLSVDQALVSQILPDKEAFAKDLGIVNIAATLPNVIAPLAAAGIVSATGGYGALFPAVAVVAGAGALAVLPIKSAR